VALHEKERPSQLGPDGAMFQPSAQVTLEVGRRWHRREWMVEHRRPSWHATSVGRRWFQMRHAAFRRAQRLAASGADVAIFRREVGPWERVSPGEWRRVASSSER
jgi:hypothetical protein